MNIPNSIKFKLPFLTLCGVISGAALAIVIGSTIAEKSFKNKTEENIYLKIQVIESTLNEWNDSNIMALNFLISQPDIISMNPELQKPILAKMTDGTRFYRAMTLDPKGHNVARNDSNKLKYFGDRDYFKGLRNGIEITQQSLLGRSSKRLANCLAKNIATNELEFVGAAVICVDLKQLTEDLGKLNFAQTGVAMVIDDRGNVLAHPDPHYRVGEKLKNLSYYPPVKHLLLGGSNSKFTFYDGGKSYVSYSTRLNNGWGVLVVMAESEFLASKNQFRSAMLIVGGFLVIGLGLFTWGASSYLIAPVSRLNAAASAISSGRIRKINLSRKDEFGNIANAINLLVFKLQKSTEKIEGEVTKRTKLAVDRSLAKIEAKNLAKENLQKKTINSLTKQIRSLAAVEVTPKNSRTIKLKSQFLASTLEDLRNLLYSNNCLSNYSSVNTMLDLKQLCKDAIAIATHDKIKVNYWLDPNLPHNLKGDRKLLWKVLVNLLNNAVKFSDRGQVRLLVTQVASNCDRSEIKFSIIDTGIGIERKNQSKIFKPFYQVNSEIEGLGLGLTVSQQIIKALNSQIEVTSKIKEGSEFSFKLIFEKVAATIRPQKPRQSSILLVDDSIVYQQFLSILLENCNHTVTIAGNLEDALQQLDGSNSFDLILTELLMPNKKGLSLIEKARKINLYKNVPILVVSASLSESIKQGFSSKKIDFMNKPIVPEELLKKVQLLLKKGENNGQYLTDFKEQLIANEKKLFSE